MSMRSRRAGKQKEFWIATDRLANSPGHPFYRKLNRLLAAHGFDAFAEEQCRGFYAEKLGRPSVPPGVYFRMLMVGYFEGLDSERGIDWRCADSLALREFLGYSLEETTPDHSTLSRARQRIDLDTHRKVFTWVLTVLAQEGCLKGESIGIDATTLEANAAMRSIVRRDTGESYEEFLRALAQASGIDTPTREDLARVDRQRKRGGKGKASNDDWKHPHDPDARITKMKDGTTHMGHKAEHAVDMDTEALVAVTVQDGDRGDTSSVYGTLAEASENLREVREEVSEEEAEHLGEGIEELVGDKGYHSNDVLRDMAELELRTYVSEPDRGRRNWKGRGAERRAVYANRRRIRGSHGRALLRRRGEVVERSFAHAYETGGMRRTHLRGHENILKRVLIHAGGRNLSLVMRKMTGAGTPRGLTQARREACELLFGLFSRLLAAAGLRRSGGAIMAPGAIMRGRIVALAR